MSTVRQETARGIKWGLIQKFTMQPIQFVYGVILARLISPEEMGILGLTAIFFAVAISLQNAGFGAALIRKQDRTQADSSTVFWFNVVASAGFAVLLALAAPWFAEFFDQPALVNLTRVSAVMMFFQSTAGVHQALYSARRDFKTPAIISMVSTLAAMPFTIWAAFAGWSYWAPVLQGVLSGGLSLVLIWILSPWRPSLVFSQASFRYFFGFGSRLTLAGLVCTVYSELRTFLIGKFYSPAQLAFFSRGYATCSTPLSLVQGVLGNVTYPILASIQEDESRLLGVYRQYIRLTALTVEWAMITLAANSSSLILLLYGERWLPCALYAQLLCFGIMLDPLSNINSNLYAVLGRTDVTLKKETILRVFGLSAMILGAMHSVTAVCISAVATGMFAFVLSMYLTSTICSLKMREQILDFVPYTVMAVTANVPGYLLSSTMDWHPLILLTVSGLSSLMLYVAFLFVRRDKTAAYLMTLMPMQQHVLRLRFITKHK